jgi:ArsR family transcriptional regulator
MCYALQYIDVGKYEEVPKPMPQEQIIMLKAITDESRLRIIKLLEQGEQCACVLLENLHFSQPTLSHHMKVLCEAGLVNSRKEGRWVYYSLNQANGRELARFIQDLFQVTNTGDDHHACC